MSQTRDIPASLAAIDRQRPQDRYSRFVAAAKRLLPLLAVALLALVALWPRVGINFQHLANLPRIDPREAHDLRMVNPHYTGVDRDNRPYVLTADAARQLSSDINDLIGLEGPKADVTSAAGGWIEISAYAGTYQPQPQTLDLFGNVALYMDRGDEFHTDSATIDLARNSAEGREPVTGQGPFGHVESEGFRVLDRGDTLMFTGHVTLRLEPHPTKVGP